MSIYLPVLAFSSVLMAASLFLGGDSDSVDDLDHDFDLDGDLDADLDVDLDADLDADLDHDFDPDFDIPIGTDGSIPTDFVNQVEAESMAGPAHLGARLPFFSMRFWTFALFSFGLSGSILSYLGTGEPTSLIVSGLTGLALGWLIWWMFRMLKRGSGGTPEDLERGYQGHEARTLLPVPVDGLGKIRMDLGEQQLDLLARTREKTPIDKDQVVLIVSVDKGIACVTPLRPALNIDIGGEK